MDGDKLTPDVEAVAEDIGGDVESVHTTPREDVIPPTPVSMSAESSEVVDTGADASVHSADDKNIEEVDSDEHGVDASGEGVVD